MRSYCQPMRMIKRITRSRKNLAAFLKSCNTLSFTNYSWRNHKGQTKFKTGCYRRIYYLPSLYGTKWAIVPQEEWRENCGVAAGSQMSEKHRGALSVFLKTPHHLQPLLLTVCLKRFFLKAVCQLPTVSWDDRAVNFQTGVMTPRTRLLPTAALLPKGHNITIVVRVCRATKFFREKKTKTS